MALLQNYNDYNAASIGADKVGICVIRFSSKNRPERYARDAEIQRSSMRSLSSAAPETKCCPTRNEPPDEKIMLLISVLQHPAHVLVDWRRLLD